MSSTVGPKSIHYHSNGSGNINLFKYKLIYI